MGSWIDLTSADGFVVPAWLARPAGAPRGAVVVLQEIFGVNAHIRDVTERYAAAGYLALAPATFARVQPGVELSYSAADMQQGVALKSTVTQQHGVDVWADMQAAITYAAEDCGGKVGIVGFCWGGLLAWQAACELQGLSAAVCYYGGGMTTVIEAAREPHCPVLAHFGRRDHFIAEAGVHLFAAAHPKQVEVHLYDADHGFHCDQRGSYDPAAAESANVRTLAFLAQHLG